MTILSPAADSTPDPGIQQLPKGEPETDLNPELPAAHLIGKHLVDRRVLAMHPHSKRESFGSAMTLLVLSQLLHHQLLPRSD